MNKSFILVSGLLAAVVVAPARIRGADVELVYQVEVPSALRESDGRSHVYFYVPKARANEKTNHWDPETGRFPVDLAKYAETARKLINQVPGLPGPVSLDQVRIDTSRNRNGRCCIIVYTFDHPDLPRNRVETVLKTCVVMLIDGTIAQVRTEPVQ